MNTRRLLGLCLIPVLLAMLDGSVTLIGQPAAYWDDHSRVLEGTPGFRILLTHGPAAFIAGHVVWQLAFVGMILLLPSTPALAISLMFTLNHTIGAFSWINRFHFSHTRELPFVINAIAAAGLALGIRWWTRPPHDTPLWASLPGGFRWTVVALLKIAEGRSQFLPNRAVAYAVECLLLITPPSLSAGFPPRCGRDRR